MAEDAPLPTVVPPPPPTTGEPVVEVKTEAGRLLAGLLFFLVVFAAAVMGTGLAFDYALIAGHIIEPKDRLITADTMNHFFYFAYSIVGVGALNMLLPHRSSTTVKTKNVPLAQVAPLLEGPRLTLPGWRKTLGNRSTERLPESDSHTNRE